MENISYYYVILFDVGQEIDLSLVSRGEDSDGPKLEITCCPFVIALVK